MSLIDMLSRVAKRMEFEIEDIRDAFTHGGVKGSALENTVVETFLRPYLPERIGICTGQLIDSSGQHSKQLDVVLYDRPNTPMLKRSGEIRLLPVECVFAVIEVKARISSSQDIEGIFANMASVRALSRTAFTPDPRLHFVQMNHHGKPVSTFPVQYSCFAFEWALALDSVEKKFNEEIASRGLTAHNCVDMAYMLNVGLWALEAGPPVGFERVAHGSEMVGFYLRIQQHISMAMMAGFLDLDKYLGALESPPAQTH